uniref:MF7 protein n=1 Tax=Schistosoma japonicum TaxID=6182 RepID=Q8T4J6_SCHJA|nr:MF7 protein [Schistosoma japonicum]
MPQKNTKRKREKVGEEDGAKERLRKQGLNQICRSKLASLRNKSACFPGRAREPHLNSEVTDCQKCTWSRGHPTGHHGIDHSVMSKYIE